MKGNYIYMFLSETEKPLYIGISINLVNRIETQHFKSSNGNLSLECIHETDRILYHQAVSSDDMKVKERYLINKLNPKYNVKMIIYYTIIKLLVFQKNLRLLKIIIVFFLLIFQLHK